MKGEKEIGAHVDMRNCKETFDDILTLVSLPFDVDSLLRSGENFITLALRLCTKRRKLFGNMHKPNAILDYLKLIELG